MSRLFAKGRHEKFIAERHTSEIVQKHRCNDHRLTSVTDSRQLEASVVEKRANSVLSTLYDVPPDTGSLRESSSVAALDSTLDMAVRNKNAQHETQRVSRGFFLHAKSTLSCGTRSPQCDVAHGAWETQFPTRSQQSTTLRIARNSAKKLRAFLVVLR